MVNNFYEIQQENLDTFCSKLYNGDILDKSI